jgi:lipoprotein NlpI
MPRLAEVTRARGLAYVVGWIALGVGMMAQQESPRAALNRAVEAFAAGRIAEAAAAFDAVTKLSPGDTPYLWQRGIALYYAGRYSDCHTQFELHRTVNPDDVENAAWHFLCVAREQSPDAARKQLLPVGPDPRVPMREIYQMFSGSLDPEKVIEAAGRGLQGRFYAHLYVGLYAEALGDSVRALEHVEAAADDRYAQAGGYMHMVAQVHRGLLRTRR